MQNLSNKSEAGIQVFITRDKEVIGDTLTVRFNGKDDKLAGKSGYECALPLTNAGVVEELIRAVREENGIPSYAEKIAEQKHAEELAKQAREVFDSLTEKQRIALREVRLQSGDQNVLKWCEPKTMESLAKKDILDALKKDEEGKVLHWSNDPLDYVLTELGLKVAEIQKAEEEIKEM